MRQYQPIWERIKAVGEASLVAHPTATSRIIKAVVKEKFKDIEYKAYLFRKRKRAKLEILIDENRNIITFKLTYTQRLSIIDL